MNNMIKQQIEDLKSKKTYLDGFRDFITDKRNIFEKHINDEKKEFEESLKPFQERLNAEIEEYNFFSNQTISISLNDLINELSKLTGLPSNDFGIIIETNIGYWGGRHSLNRIIDLMDDEDQLSSCTGNYDKYNYWELTIYADKHRIPENLGQTFYYRLFFDLDLSEIQYDGKPLIEHCGVKTNNDDITRQHYTSLIIDKDIGNLKCNIKLRDLVREDKLDGYGKWYPADLFNQAVINAVNKQIETGKTRKLIK